MSAALQFNPTAPKRRLGVDNSHRLIHTRRPTQAEATLHETQEIPDVWSDETDRARAELLAEATAEVRARARRYVQEPAEAAWHDLVEALTRAYGDNETYDLLRAVAIHAQTRRP
jgi:hypothetical protein